MPLSNLNASRGARRAALALAATLLLATGVAGAQASNKWRIEVDNDAVRGGQLVLELAPVSGTPVTVEVTVPAGTPENDVAALIRDALQVKLGSSYGVEVDDGEDVLVKKQDGAADFDLRVQRGLEGVEIELGRE